MTIPLVLCVAKGRSLRAPAPLVRIVPLRWMSLSVQRITDVPLAASLQFRAMTESFAKQPVVLLSVMPEIIAQHHMVPKFPVKLACIVHLEAESKRLVPSGHSVRLRAPVMFAAVLGISARLEVQRGLLAQSASIVWIQRRSWSVSWATTALNLALNKNPVLRDTTALPLERNESAR